MKKLKDIYYDLNDIMVALIILAIAAVVIAANINSILNYPSIAALEAKAPEEKTPTTYADNPPITNDLSGAAVTKGGSDTAGGKNASAGQTTSGGSVTTPPGKVENYAVYINSGETGDQIADKLIGVGLFKDRTEFRTAVTAAGADGKLKAGNFIIPSNATHAEVIAILVK